MSKYNAGDRVVNLVDGTDSKAGQVGTVMESGSLCPWVKYDTPTTFETVPWGLKFPTSEADRGYFDCRAEDELTPYGDHLMVNPVTAAVFARAIIALFT